jgi:hypothetical protein
MGMFAETAIDDRYHMTSKENKLSFFASVCSKQIEVCCFSFLFAAKKT